MIRQLISRDSVALTGSFIGLASVLLGWLTLKPNRLASGTSFSLWEATGWDITAVLLGLWLICLVFSMLAKGKAFAVVLGITANLILVFTFVIAGLTASQLLEGEAPIARVSLGAGWE